MEDLQLDMNKRYSYADYLTWFDDKRRELIDGFIKMMTPAPARNHQEVLTNLFRDISYFLKKKKCKIYTAPFDVRLPVNDKENEKTYNVVQPDICIICDKTKLDEKGCIGAPDMIIEIVSPSSSERDVKDKYALYEKVGVKEYWIVYPAEKTISVFKLKEGKYILDAMYAGKDKIQPGIFKGALTIQLDEIFE